MNSGNPSPEVCCWSDLAAIEQPEWPLPSASLQPKLACVEYVGRTALVVTGPYTGARYRFLQPGARVTVDARDRQAMLSIPMLRAVH